MADIRIHRAHRLGLAQARKTAFRWAEQVEEKFGMECTVIEGNDSDVVEFTRSGVDGRLVVTAVAFDLTARLGLLIGAFRQRIESEIEQNLDDLLAKAERKKTKR
ncbi:MAG: polyhydroxyalkanoic acid system family protein [Caldimonas sp.]